MLQGTALRPAHEKSSFWSLAFAEPKVPMVAFRPLNMLMLVSHERNSRLYVTSSSSSSSNIMRQEVQIHSALQKLKNSDSQGFF